MCTWSFDWWFFSQVKEERAQNSGQKDLEEKQQELNKRKTQRAIYKKKMLAKTKHGQPVMKHQIGYLLHKIKQNKWCFKYLGYINFSVCFFSFNLWISHEKVVLIIHCDFCFLILVSDKLSHICLLRQFLHRWKGQITLNRLKGSSDK